MYFLVSADVVTNVDNSVVIYRLEIIAYLNHIYMVLGCGITSVSFTMEISYAVGEIVTNFNC